MIEIHWDYTDGTEVSWIEGLKLCDNFTTCCTKFFNQDVITDDVVVLRKDGKKVSRRIFNYPPISKLGLGITLKSYYWVEH